MQPRILLVGATGLVGQGVLEVLLQAELEVTVLVRRAYTPPSDAVRVLQARDFSASALDALDLSGIDACLYCAGPLPLGQPEATYREATVGALERVATAYARANPEGYLIYVSGAGSDADSRWMPLRVKGEAEAVPGQVGLASTCLRPGGIRPTQGERSPHDLRRGVYALGSPALALVQKTLPGHFTTTEAVGRCMLDLVQAGSPYPAVVENREINAFASSAAATGGDGGT